MIYIEKGSVNNLVLTLSESTTIGNPVYLFKFVWEMDFSVDPVYAILTDISSYTQRYNLFELEEGVDATFRIGQYTYEVYESAFGSAPADETGLTMVESGRMVVNGTATTIYD